MAEDEKTVQTEESQKPSVSEEDLVLLRSKAGKFDEFEEHAKADGFESAEEHRDAVEEMAYNKIVEADKAEQPETKKSEVESTPETKLETKPEGLSPKVEELMDQMQRQIAASNLTAQWAEFRLVQRDLPEDERTSHSKKELMKVLTRSGAKVSAVIDQFDGNAFAAADFIASVPELRKRAKERGEASDEAKEKAAASASVSNDGQVAAPTTETAQEKAARLNDEAATRIAQPTEYQYPG